MTFSLESADAGGTPDPADGVDRDRSDAAGTEGVPDWQARALERSLGGVRALSVERLGQFVNAARELATETASSDFTVQQLVERAGLSLKSFYRYFEGKDDLLFALLEEDSRIGAALLEELIDVSDKPEKRLRAYVDELFNFLSVGPRGYVSVLVHEHRRLGLASPAKMRTALAPFHRLLERELVAAAQAGLVRQGDFQRDAINVFELVLTNINEVVLGTDGFSPRDASDYVWSFCWNGLKARPA